MEAKQHNQYDNQPDNVQGVYDCSHQNKTFSSVAFQSIFPFFQIVYHDAPLCLFVNRRMIDKFVFRCFFEFLVNFFGAVIAVTLFAEHGFPLSRRNFRSAKVAFEFFHLILFSKT